MSYKLRGEFKLRSIKKHCWFLDCTAQKMKFSIKDFFSKCDQIRSFLHIWSHLLKKSLMENFMFCAKLAVKPLIFAKGTTFLGAAFVSPISRSRRTDVFLRKCALKIYSKSTGGHPCRSLVSIKLLCIISTSFQTILMLFFTNCHVQDCNMSDSLLSINRYLSQLNTSLMCFISLDRYLHVKFSKRYQRQLKNSEHCFPNYRYYVAAFSVDFFKYQKLYRNQIYHRSCVIGSGHLSYHSCTQF